MRKYSFYHKIFFYSIIYFLYFPQISISTAKTAWEI